MKRLTRFHVVAVSAAALALLAPFALGVVHAADSNTAPAASNTATARPAASNATSAVDKDEQRIKSLHDRLQITQPQEAQWGRVAEVMRSNDRTMDGLAKTRRDTAATRTAAEDLHSYGEITEAHAAGIRSFAVAFEPLYNSMTKVQKTNADEVFRSKDKKAHKDGA